MERPARAAFVGALIAALITLPGLGAGTLWDNSETAYGEVAREILLTHDWVVMHLNGAVWFVQPPLYFWITALSALVFGITSFAFRLPAALATIVMGAVTGWAVARQAGTRVGIYASVILSSCFMQAIIGRLAIMDALLDLAVAFAVFWWFRCLESGRDRYFIYGWIAAALGFLAKGPVALVIALLVIVPFAWWNSRVENTHLPSPKVWLWGCCIAILIVAPWLIAVGVHSGPQAIVELIGHYTVGRYTGVIENQSGPIWYYFPVLILGFFPWIAFFPMAVVYGVRQLRSPDTDAEIARLWRLGFTWIVLPFVFFSLAKTKLPNYIALEFPALALVTALYFDSVVRKGLSRSAIVSAACVPIFIGMVAIAIAVFVRDNRLTSDARDVLPDLILMGSIIFAGSLLTAILLSIRRTVPVAPYALAAAALVSMDILAMFALPHAEAFKPIPHLAKVIEAQLKPGDAIAIDDYHGGNALIFYTRPPVFPFSQEVACSNDRIWVVEPKKRSSPDPTYGRNRDKVSEWGTAALYLVHGPPCHGG